MTYDIHLDDKYGQMNFHWHKHDGEDEFFLVLEGKLLIDFEDQDSVELTPQLGYTVPRGVVHRTPRARRPHGDPHGGVERRRPHRRLSVSPSGRGNPTRAAVRRYLPA